MEFSTREKGRTFSSIYSAFPFYYLDFESAFDAIYIYIGQILWDLPVSLWKKDCNGIWNCNILLSLQTTFLYLYRIEFQENRIEFQEILKRSLIIGLISSQSFLLLSYGNVSNGYGNIGKKRTFLFLSKLFSTVCLGYGNCYSPI